MDSSLANLLSFLGLLFWAALMAVLVRRLLGQRVGWPRSVVVCAVALGVFAPVMFWLSQLTGFMRADGSLTIPAALAVGIGALVFAWVLALCTMVLVILEALVPTGSIPSPLRWPASIAAWVRRSVRYWQLGWIVVSSGLGSALRQGPASERFDSALVTMFERAGVSFVKLGQILSTRQDVVPASTALALSKLQADAAPAPQDAMVAELDKAWGMTPDDALGSFDPRPLGAASIAQVYPATLKDGTEVVIKAQRPEAAASVRVDGDILTRFSRTAVRRFEWARDIGLADLTEGLMGVMREELDYRIEAENTRTAERLLGRRSGLRMPHVIDELSGEKVLVITRLRGVPVADGVARLSMERRQELAKTLMGWVLQGVMVDGFFHADLHPGNLLLLDGDEGLGVLDFGAVGVIDSETRLLLAGLLTAILEDDNTAAATALCMAFDVPSDVDMRQLRRDLGRAITLVHSSGEAGATLFTQLFALLRQYHVRIPGDVAGAFRTLASVEETLTTLDPSSSLVSMAKQGLPELAARIAQPRRVLGQASSEMLVAASIARRLPDRVERVSSALSSGTFSLLTRPLADGHERSWLRGLVDDAISSAFAAVLAVLAVVVALAPGAPLTDVITVNQLFGGILGLFAAVLGLRVVVRVFARRGPGVE